MFKNAVIFTPVILQENMIHSSSLADLWLYFLHFLNYLVLLHVVKTLEIMYAKLDCLIVHGPCNILFSLHICHIL